MNKADIHHLILEQLSELAPEADLDELDQEIDFREALDIDSFDFVRFITGLSEALGVEVPEEDYTKLATLVGAEAYLCQKTEK